MISSLYKINLFPISINIASIRTNWMDKDPKNWRQKNRKNKDENPESKYCKNQKNIKRANMLKNRYQSFKV